MDDIGIGGCDVRRKKDARSLIVAHFEANKQKPLARALERHGANRHSLGMPIENAKARPVSLGQCFLLNAKLCAYNDIIIYYLNLILDYFYFFSYTQANSKKRILTTSWYYFLRDNF